MATSAMFIFSNVILINSNMYYWNLLVMCTLYDNMFRKCRYNLLIRSQQLLLCVILVESENSSVFPQLR